MKIRLFSRQFAFVFFLLFFVTFLSSCEQKVLMTEQKQDYYLEKVDFENLKGWEHANIFLAKEALIKSCERIKSYDKGEVFKIAHIKIDISTYKNFCFAINSSSNNKDLKNILKKYFFPYLVKSKNNSMAHYTAYVELEVEGSLVKSDKSYVPIYSKPDLLVQINPEDFPDQLRGKKTIALLKNGKLISAPTRKKIDSSNIFKEHIIAYLNDPARAYFLHVQGAGRLKLPDGSLKLIGYSGDNGKKYKSIGKILIEKGYIEKKKLSMQSIERWMHNNPKEARSVMNMNERYIFFKFRKEKNPVGSSGVELTSFYSAAVDNKFIPYHTILWSGLDLKEIKSMENRNIFIAQDSGAAIRGPMRIDLFLGYGKGAETVAGGLSKKEKLWVLIPRKIVPKGN